MDHEQVNDGRVAILGGARLVESEAVGEIFADLPSGEVVTVVVRMAPDGAVRVQVMNRHGAPLEVSVEGEPVFGPAARAPELTEELETVLTWARIHVADTSTSDRTDRECYGLISRVAEAFGVEA